MSAQPFTHLKCPVVVLRVTTTQVMGDTLADAIRDEIITVYGQTRFIHVVIDMEPVTYISSAGIRPLLGLNRLVREREGRLVLCNLNEDVKDVLLTTRLISGSKSTPATFETQPDVPAAVASLYQ